MDTDWINESSSEQGKWLVNYCKRLEIKEGKSPPIEQVLNGREYCCLSNLKNMIEAEIYPKFTHKVLAAWKARQRRLGLKKNGLKSIHFELSIKNYTNLESLAKGKNQTKNHLINQMISGIYWKEKEKLLNIENEIESAKNNRALARVLSAQGNAQLGEAREENDNLRKSLEIAKEEIRNLINSLNDESLDKENTNIKNSGEKNEYDELKNVKAECLNEGGYIIKDKELLVMANELCNQLQLKNIDVLFKKLVRAYNGDLEVRSSFINDLGKLR